MIVSPAPASIEIGIAMDSEITTARLGEIRRTGFNDALELETAELDEEELDVTGGAVKRRGRVSCNAGLLRSVPCEV